MKDTLPAEVTVREVGPRDGLQAEDAWVETEAKIRLIDLLSGTGLKRIEATSFVHPGAVPQMRDAAEVMAAVRRVPGVRYEAIVPNAKGAARAVESGADQVGIFISATESHNRANVRMSVQESIAQIPAIVEAASAADPAAPADRAGQAGPDALGGPAGRGGPAGLGGLSVRGCVSVAFGCPYEGEVSLEQVFRVIRGYRGAGIGEIVLGDTTGMANPVQVAEVSRAVLREFPGVSLTLHFHDTRGAGLANVVAGLQAGVTAFDASIGGLGGCPYAPGATGNIPTEDLVYLLEEMGVRTGVDLDALLDCARYAAALVDRELPGRLVKAGRPVALAPPRERP